jgi:hypothetical protein
MNTDANILERGKKLPLWNSVRHLQDRRVPKPGRVPAFPKSVFIGVHPWLNVPRPCLWIQ